MRPANYSGVDGSFDPPGSHGDAPPDLLCEHYALPSTYKHITNQKLNLIILSGSRSPQTTLWATAPARRLCENN